jgi:tetratricopeptide (TPR) repeat protein
MLPLAKRTKTEQARKAGTEFAKTKETKLKSDVLAYNNFSREDEQILYAVLKKKIEFFPESPTAHEALGYAYYWNNRKERAIACYENALELDPESRNAMRMIKQLRN